MALLRPLHVCWSCVSNRPGGLTAQFSPCFLCLCFLCDMGTQGVPAPWWWGSHE